MLLDEIELMNCASWPFEGMRLVDLGFSAASLVGSVGLSPIDPGRLNLQIAVVSRSAFRFCSNDDDDSRVVVLLPILGFRDQLPYRILLFSVG